MARFEDSPASVNAKLRAAIMRDLKVAFPAEVVAYDASKQTVDVRPLLADFFANESDGVDQVFPGVIPAVPVAFQGGGGYRETFPVAAGDTVQILVNDRSLDAWLAQ